MLPIIGISGYAGSGKDTVAGVLVNKYGFVRIGLADPLREMLWALNPKLDVGYYNGNEDQDYRVQDAVRELGWDKAKREFDEIRQLLQRLGTEAGRKVFGDRIWINTATERIPFNAVINHNLGIVVPDVRFENEAEWIHHMKGAVVRVVRQGFGPVNDHVSDAGIDDRHIDFTINNSVDFAEDPESLNLAVEDLVMWIRKNR